MLGITNAGPHGLTANKIKCPSHDSHHPGYECILRSAAWLKLCHVALTPDRRVCSIYPFRPNKHCWRVTRSGHLVCRKKRLTILATKTSLPILLRKHNLATKVHSRASGISSIEGCHFTWICQKHPFIWATSFFTRTGWRSDNPNKQQSVLFLVRAFRM